MNGDIAVLDGRWRCFEMRDLSLQGVCVSLRAAQDQFGAVPVDAAPIDVERRPAMFPFPIGLGIGGPIGSAGIGLGRKQMDARLGIVPGVIVIGDRWPAVPGPWAKWYRSSSGYRTVPAWRPDL